MADPTCPACHHPLRAFRGRLCCDGCNGIFLTLDDLAAAVFDLTSVTPTLEFTHEHAGKRACPQCGKAMSTCKVVIKLDNDTGHPRPELDHCAEHGLWFDDEELAKVFEPIASKGYGGGVGRKQGPWSDGPVDQGAWSAMFKNRYGGHGGW